MEYNIKGDWKVKELSPLHKSPTCRVFKIVPNESAQILCEYDSFHNLELTLKISRSSISFKEEDILMSKNNGSLGRICKIFALDGKVHLITEKYEISNNSATKDPL